jgi:sensor domain CHASE-containing protein
LKKKIVAFFVAALVSVSGATACGAVQDEVQQQAEDEVNKQKTKAEQKLQQEKTKAIEKAKTTAAGG